jgi:putative ABC transport system permease protein
MRTFLQDLVYSARSLAKARDFTLIAVVTLALGIAANTVVFSVVNAALLRPLPYANPERIVILNWYDQHGLLSQEIPAATFFLLQERARAFQAIAATYSPDVGVNLAGLGSPRYVTALRVSAKFFRMLRVAPALGRDFRDEEDNPGGETTAILSHQLWMQEFAGDPSILGRQIRVNGKAHTVIGVMPRGFRSYPEADLWLPLQLSPATAEAGNEYTVYARLRDGVSTQEARHELESSKDYSLTYPLAASTPGVKLALHEWQGFMVGGVRKGILFLFLAVVLVLLIACTNLAVLLTVRTLARNHEFATRAALGASKMRLVLIPFMDSIVIAVVGGIAGIILAKEAVPVLATFVPADIPLRGPIQLDGRVLLFAVSISLATAVIFGLAPVLRLFRIDLGKILRRSPHSASAGWQETRVVRILVSAQIALTFILLSSAISLLRSFLGLQAVPPGFDPQSVSVAQVSLGAPHYVTTSATMRLLEQVDEQMRSVPGVEDVASVSGLPFENGLNLPIFPADSPKNVVYGQYRIVSPAYFRTMRIPVTAGRAFSPSDNAGSAPVAIVNESLARIWWPMRSPLGRSVAIVKGLGEPFSDASRQVVGVAADVREAGLDRDPPPTIFVPAAQAPDTITSFVHRLFLTSVVVRTANRNNISENFRTTFTAADPDLPIASVRPLTQVMASSLAVPRFYVWLTAGFSAFALLLAAIGLYGLLSYQLFLRTREIGIRIAVGAKPAAIVALVLKQGAQLIAIGSIVGLIGSILVGKVTATMIYNPQGIHLGVLAATTVLLATVALATSLVVAVRATGIEPVEALGTE